MLTGNLISDVGVPSKSTLGGSVSIDKMHNLIAWTLIASAAQGAVGSRRQKTNTAAVVSVNAAWEPTATCVDHCVTTFFVNNASSSDRFRIYEATVETGQEIGR